MTGKLPCPPFPPQGESNPIMLLPQKARKAMETGHGYKAHGATHFGCCLCLELEEGCDWEDWGVVLAWSWYWGVVMGWLGVV